jgi:hypothetical protein
MTQADTTVSGSGVDIFEGVADVATPENSDVTDTNSAEGADVSESDTPERPIETVAVVPDGAMSVTDFAAHMTQTLMRNKFAAGEDFDQSDYVVPQAVYQTVKAARDRIPQVMVKGENDAEARVYILRDEATTWWLARRDRLSTRGSGTARASSRTADDNLALLGAAVEKYLYALSRQKMWNERVDQNAKLIDKYKGFLSDQSVAEDTVTLTIQEATDNFNAEQAKIAAEKAAKAKKPATADESAATAEPIAA